MGWSRDGRAAPAIPARVQVREGRHEDVAHRVGGNAASAIASPRARGAVTGAEDRILSGCGSNPACTAIASRGASVWIKVDETPPGHRIGSWVGCTAAPGADRCDLTMDGDKTVTVTFVRP